MDGEPMWATDCVVAPTPGLAITILEIANEFAIKEKLFAEFDEFMGMNIEENSESDTKEPPFKKIIFNTDYKIKTSLKEPPTDLELKPLHDHLEYIFLEEPTFLPLIISSQLSEQNIKYQEKDKSGTKPDKNGKRGEAGKSQEQYQSIKQEKLKKMQVEG
uniref:DNA-directed DNA polymerase n=1 Tax=Tanacetum cinerariifolium TaxID=118510 RepID=A0A6L2KZJ8_TANCI|nr:DNA-directed DNA polymerase [Tanacetum cinerariifolium]